MSKRNILITGATGYLGRALLDSLVSSDFSNIIGVLRDGKSPPEIYGIRWIPYSDLMSDPDSLINVDIVCHLAVPRGSNNGTDLATSVDDLRIILQKASKSNVTGFIYASSQAVYGATQPPWKENAALSPMTPHGWAKLASEQLVLSYQDQSIAMRCINLRIPKLVGPGPCFRMNLGEHVHSLVYSSLQEKMLHLSSNFLKQKFDFMDVRDAGNVICKIAQKDTASWPSVLNIGTGKIIDGAELVDIINRYGMQKYGKPLNYLEVPKSIKLRDFGMNIDLFNNTIGDYSTLDLDKIVIDVFQFVSCLPSEDLH